ncbi:MAG TPA: Ku protein [Nocardioidaceae bacterium]|nr:Ku protein [Nocardioidaceae bacterium]
MLASTTRRAGDRHTGRGSRHDDIVKGADIGDGKYVVLAPEDLEQVEPGRSRTIEISDFVDVAEIDPVFYEKTYYLAPQDEGAKKAYGLLQKSGAKKSGTTKSGAAKSGAAKESAQDVRKLSKAQLYNLAQELGQTGRSRMSRDELVAAVGSAQGGDKKAS